MLVRHPDLGVALPTLYFIYELDNGARGLRILLAENRPNEEILYVRAGTLVVNFFYELGFLRGVVRVVEFLGLEHVSRDARVGGEVHKFFVVDLSNPLLLLFSRQLLNLRRRFLFLFGLNSDGVLVLGVRVWLIGVRMRLV